MLPSCKELFSFCFLNGPCSGALLRKKENNSAELKGQLGILTSDLLMREFKDEFSSFFLVMQDIFRENFLYRGRNFYKFYNFCPFFGWACFDDSFFFFFTTLLDRTLANFSKNVLSRTLQILQLFEI